jgi:hypothetical protein
MCPGGGGGEKNGGGDEAASFNWQFQWRNWRICQDYQSPKFLVEGKRPQIFGDLAKGMSVANIAKRSLLLSALVTLAALGQ